MTYIEMCLAAEKALDARAEELMRRAFTHEDSASREIDLREAAVCLRGATEFACAAAALDVDDDEDNDEIPETP